MRPLIEYGDTVVIRHTTQGIHPGSIVAYKRGERIIIHRVLRRLQATGEVAYLNKGDANPRRDPLVRERALIGRVTSVVKKGRTIDVENAYWRVFGYLMVCWAGVVSVFPGLSPGTRLSKTLRRLLVRTVLAA
jgi:signal peptidase I